MNHSQNEQSTKELLQEIAGLKEERHAVIIAHNYQTPEIQDLADYTGDSLELSRIAAKTDAKVIVFCGVKFMAETAAILSPDKTVLLPVMEAGCTLADHATAIQIRELKKKHPGAVVVTYVNSSAEVKAESDICCTSANAVEIVGSVDPSKEIIFAPDYNLGHYAAKMTKRKLILWDGCCPTHALLSTSNAKKAKDQWPKAIFMMHPECKSETLEFADYIGSTSAMIRYAKQQPAKTEFIVGTETGLLHRLQKENPDKIFHIASDFLICPMMKMISLKDVREALKKMQYIITVSDDVRSRANAAVEAMLGNTGKKAKTTPISLTPETESSIGIEPMGAN